MEELGADGLEGGRESRTRRNCTPAEQWASDRVTWQLLLPLQGGYNFCKSKRVEEKSYDEGRELRKGLETVPGCFPAVLLICLLNKQPQIGTLAQPFGGISNFPAPRAHRPQCGSSRDLEVMPALPSRGMCWKLAALIYQSPAEGTSRSAGLKISQFLSQQSCVWCTTEMRCEHTQHSPWSHSWHLMTLRKWALSFFAASSVTSEGHLCLSPATAATKMKNHFKTELLHFTAILSSLGSSFWERCFLSARKTVNWELKLVMIWILVTE